MADATKKTRKSPGPRKVRPLYLITKGSDKVEVISVTRDPLAIVQAMSDGNPVSFVDLNKFMPEPATRNKAA